MFADAFSSPCVLHGLFGSELGSFSESALPFKSFIFSCFIVAILSKFEVIAMAGNCIDLLTVVFSCAFLVVGITSLEHCLFFSSSFFI